VVNGVVPIEVYVGYRSINSVIVHCISLTAQLIQSLDQLTLSGFTFTVKLMKSLTPIPTPTPAEYIFIYANVRKILVHAKFLLNQRKG